MTAVPPRRAWRPDPALAPAVALLRRLPYAAKFAVVVTVVLVALALSARSHLVDADARLDDLGRKHEGVALLGPVLDLGRELERRREEVVTSLAIAPADTSGPWPAYAPPALVSALQRARVAAQDNPAVPPGPDWAPLEELVLSLAAPPTDPPAWLAGHDRALALHRSVVRDVIDRSGLGVDEDAHVGYLLDALGRDIPELLAAARQLKEPEVIARQDGEPMDRDQLASAAARLADAQAALGDDLARGAPAGGRADLLDVARPLLDGVAHAYGAAEQARERSHDDLAARDRLVTRTDVGELVRTSGLPARTGLGRLDALLVERGDDLRRRLAWQLTPVALVMALAAYLFLAAFRSTGRDLATVLDDLDAVSDGDLNPRLALNNRDEFGAMSRGVEQARLRISRLIEQLVAQGQRFQTLVQASSDLTLISGPDGTLTYVSPAVSRLLGVHPDAWLGHRLGGLVVPEDRARVDAALAAASASGGASSTEFRVRRADGSLRTLDGTCRDLQDDATVRGIVWNTRDVSDRRALEDRLTHQAFHDPLTRLPNRALFAERLEQALELSQAGGELAPAVLLLDLDGFKDVNDSLGHAAGDQVLVELAARLTGCTRQHDTVARLGGDEFAFLVRDVGTPEAATVAAGRVRASLEEPCHLGDLALTLRASIGIAVADEHTPDAENLLRDADVAMYAAKAAGKDGAVVFTPTMHDAAAARLDLSAALTGAVTRGELELHYQPIADLRTGGWYGVEALARWRRPGRGVVAPTTFIPLAEETGSILAIGRWVLATAARDLSRLRASDPALAHLVTSVNVSVRQLHEAGIVEQAVRTVRAVGLRPGDLVLEITESGLIEETGLVLDRIRELRGHGFAVAIDDFGSGYSSLGHLRRIPADVLKMDKSFVDQLDVEADSAVALAGGIVTLAEALDLRTVAEGVETWQQARLLAGMGCPLLQGYLMGRPLPWDDARTALLTPVPVQQLSLPGAVSVPSS